MKRRHPAPVWQIGEHQMFTGDAVDRLRDMKTGSVQCCITSPPYLGVMRYGSDPAEIGIENTPGEYVTRLVEVFRELRRVLRRDGVLWLVIGDVYSSRGDGLGGSPKRFTKDGMAIHHASRRTTPGIRRKNMLLLPAMLATALREDGWYLRSQVIWDKPNSLRSVALDRPCGQYEIVYLLSKSARYYFSAEASRMKSIWLISKDRGRNHRHPAAFPPALVARCLLSSTRPGDVVLDPFAGSGTVGAVAASTGRTAYQIDLVPAFATIAMERLQTAINSGDVAVTGDGMVSINDWRTGNIADGLAVTTVATVMRRISSKKRSTGWRTRLRDDGFRCVEIWSHNISHEQADLQAKSIGRNW